MSPTLLLFFSILFLSILPGTDAVTTVSNVAVQSGRSVTIPCLYDSKYETNVKYWTQSYYWNSHSFVVRTDSSKAEGKTSITDDPAHHVFTVTMKNLETSDSRHYWCAVENSGQFSEAAGLYLSVTAGTPGLWVDQQEVASVEGGDVSVLCHYNAPIRMKKWCRAEGSCVEVNSAKSGRSEIRNDHLKRVFIVTMRELKMEDTAWYWCAAGELQIPVHITVTQKTTTTTVTTTTQSSASTAQHTSLPVSAATTSATATQPSTPKRSSDLTIILMVVAILLVVSVATVTWMLWKKCKGGQAKTRAREQRRNQLTTVDREDEVTYSTVLKTQSSSHRKRPPHVPAYSLASETPEDEVMYSSVILRHPQTTHSPNQPAADRASDVIYSSIAQPKK